MLTKNFVIICFFGKLIKKASPWAGLANVLLLRVKAIILLGIKYAIVETFK